MKVMKQVEQFQAQYKMQLRHTVHKTVKEHVTQCSVTPLRESFQRLIKFVQESNELTEDSEKFLLECMDVFCGE